jgi:hypothetical protein
MNPCRQAQTLVSNARFELAYFSRANPKLNLNKTIPSSVTGNTNFNGPSNKKLLSKALTLFIVISFLKLESFKKQNLNIFCHLKKSLK